MHFKRTAGVVLVGVIAVAVPGYAMETRASAGIQHNMGIATKGMLPTLAASGLTANSAGFAVAVRAENRANGLEIEVALSDQGRNTAAQQTALGFSKNKVKDPIAAGPDGANASTDGNNSSSDEGPGNCDRGGGQKGNQNPHYAVSPSS